MTGCDDASIGPDIWHSARRPLPHGPALHSQVELNQDDRDQLARMLSVIQREKGPPFEG